MEDMSDKVENLIFPEVNLEKKNAKILQVPNEIYQ